MGLESEARVGIHALNSLLWQVASKLGPGSELGAAIQKAVNGLSKVVPPGSVPPQAEMQFLQKLGMMGRQNQANVTAMRQMAGGAGAGGGQPGMSQSPVPRPPQPPQMTGGGGSMPMAA